MLVDDVAADALHEAIKDYKKRLSEKKEFHQILWFPAGLGGLIPNIPSTLITKQSLDLSRPIKGA